ncbi:MAG: ABC transporter permease [Ruminococcaceae bacterium]|nr:ABC transporter permease [Oscillospiraceae bacterium]
MKKWTRIIVSVLLLAAVLLLHHGVVQDALHILPEAALATASPPVTLSAFTGAELETPMTPVLIMPGYLETQAVTAYYTTADAPALFALTMCDGGFDAWEAGSIVISDRLAVALFLTDQAVGRMVRFNGQEYTVRGVYAEPDSLLSRLSQTTTSAVYLPLTAYPDQNAAVSEWIVGLDGAQSVEHLAPEIELRLGTNLTFRSAYNFAESRKLVQQSEDALVLLLAAVFTGLAVVFAVRYAKRRAWVLFAAAMVCVAAGIVWVLCARFPLFLPRDFVLRSGSAMEYMVEQSQLMNEKAELFFCTYAKSVLLSLAGLCGIAVVLMGTIAATLFRRRKDRE